MKKKCIKNLKITMLFAIIFVLITFFVSYASVSDNDGSAFITKAEFDSLKNNFQAQIDSYNTGIDNKIDTAIAAYLSGVTITKDPTNMWERIENSTGKNIWWQNSVSSGDDTLTPYVALSVTREIYTECVRPQAYGWYYALTAVAPETGYNIRHFVNATTGGGTDIKYFDADHFPDKAGMAGRTDYYTGDWTGSYSAGIQKAVKEKNLYYNANSSTSDGSGTRWEAHKNGSGKLILRNYYSAYYPILFFTVWDHKYNDLFSTDDKKFKGPFEDGGRGYTTAGSGTAPILTSWTTATSGTKVTGQNTSSGNYIELKGMLNAVSDLVDYSYRMFAGGAASSSIYMSLDDAQPYILTGTSNTHTLTVNESTFYDLWHKPNMEAVQTNKIAKYDLTYYDYNVTYNNTSMGSFYNEYVSQAVGEEVYVTEGCKIANIVTDGKYKLTLKLKTDIGSGNIEYAITDKKFNNNGGGVSSGARTIKTGTSASGTEIVIENVSLNKDDNIWINLYASTSGRLATIDTFEIEYMGD